MNLKHLNQVLLQLLLLPVLALSALLGVFIWGLTSAAHSEARIQHADDALQLVSRIAEHMVDEETGVRGYQVTGDQTFLQPYRAVQGPLHAEFRELRDHVVADGIDPRLVDRIVAANEQWNIASAQPLVQATHNGLDTRGDSSNLGGKERMDLIRGRLSEVNAALLSRRAQAVEHFHSTLRKLVAIAAVFTLMIALMIGIFSRSQLRSVTEAFTKAMDVMRQRSREVHASEDRLRTILKSMGEAVVVCDTNGRIESMNGTAQVLTGWNESEAIRRRIEQVLKFVSEDGTALPMPVSEVLSGVSSATVKADALLERRNGEVVAVEGIAAPILGTTGSLAGAVMVFRDVTAKRQAQAALLASEKFAVAGRLAATIAHEIHNPLDAIINLLYLLRQNPSDADREHFLELASGELDRVARISRAMLGMYRESKAPVPVDLAELLRSLLLLLERNLANAGVQVEEDLPESITVTGFPAELRQVFTNLLTNAIEASPRGAVITVHLMRKPGGAIVVIRDCGEGISEEASENLFQPFFTTKGEKGTGLGLWVSHGIVDRHSGSLRLETRTEGEDHGTDAVVFLPE